MLDPVQSWYPQACLLHSFSSFLYSVFLAEVIFYRYRTLEVVRCYLPMGFLVQLELDLYGAGPPKSVICDTPRVCNTTWNIKIWHECDCKQGILYMTQVRQRKCVGIWRKHDRKWVYMTQAWKWWKIKCRTVRQSHESFGHVICLTLEEVFYH